MISPTRSRGLTMVVPSHISDLSEEEFDRLRVKEFIGIRHGSPRWRCVCKCGQEITASSHTLKQGKTTSCGCRKVEVLQARHGGELVTCPACRRQRKLACRGICKRCYRNKSIRPMYRKGENEEAGK